MGGWYRPGALTLENQPSPWGQCSLGLPMCVVPPWPGQRRGVWRGRAGRPLAPSTSAATLALGNRPPRSPPVQDLEDRGSSGM